MLHKKIINIKKDKIIISKAEEFIKSSAYGASIIFNGTVRNNNENKEVIGMTYDSHDELVLKSFEEIYKETTEKLKILDKAVFIEHIKGYVRLGEISINWISFKPLTFFIFIVFFFPNRGSLLNFFNYIP